MRMQNKKLRDKFFRNIRHCFFSVEKDSEYNETLLASNT